LTKCLFSGALATAYRMKNHPRCASGSNWTYVNEAFIYVYVRACVRVYIKRTNWY